MHEIFVAGGFGLLIIFCLIAHRALYKAWSNPGSGCGF